MNKKMNKFLSLLLALVMTFSVGFSVVNATTVKSDSATLKLTVNNANEGHTYGIYQIFSGDLDSDTKILSNIGWGSGIAATYTDGSNTEISQLISGLDATADAAEVAKALTSSNAQAFANSLVGSDTKTYLAATPTATVASTALTKNDDGTYSFVVTKLQPGYYLIKDNTEETTTTDATSTTTYMLQIVGDTEATLKTGVPTVEKKVQDTNDSKDATKSANNDDYDDNGKIWKDSADYDIGDDVPFKLTATLPNNVTSYTEGYKIIFHDTLSAALSLNADSFKLYVGDTDVTSSTDKYTITTTDLTDGCSFEVSIPNVENIGATNNSIIRVEYTAKLTENSIVYGNPGNDNTVYLEYSNNPSSNGTGKTTEDTVTVFTFIVDITKIDGESTPKATLKGATFKLSKYNFSTKQYEEVATIAGTDSAEFKYEGVDDGLYKLEETVTPANYNTMETVYFTITAEHDSLSDDPQLTKLVGKQVVGGDAASFEAYTGTPTLSFGDETATGNGELTTGTLSTNVENYKGSELPSTGGAGTKALYTFGAILFLGAAVLLVTKRRVGKEQ